MIRLMSKSTGAGIISLLSIGVLVAGCGSGSGGSSSNGSTGGSTSASSKQLVVDLATAPANLDPGLQYDTNTYFVFRNIFDQLLTDNPKTDQIEPEVATAWKSLSPTKWQFTIRKGIKFSNGESLTPQDVVYSLQRILSPSFDSPQESNFSEVKSVSAQGQNVIITTTQPDPVLLGDLTTLSIVPEQYVKAHGNQYFNLHPVGSGPYMLKSWVQGSTVTLVRNPKYWGAKPNIASVEFRTVPSESTMISDLKSGVADIAYPIGPDHASEIKSASTLNLETTPTDRVAYLAFNTDQSPTNNLKVREAIAHALNIPLMIQKLEDGYAKQVNSTLTPIGFGYDSSIPKFSYNPKLAKNLLKQAGYHGQTLDFATSPSYPQVVIQSVQQQLGAVGINVKIVNTTQATYLEKVQSPNHSWGNIRFGGWQGTWPDASTYLYPMFYSKSIWSSWSNSSFDTAIVAAQSTLNKAQRTKYIDAALQVMHSQVPAIGLYQEYDLYGVNKNVDWQPDPLENFFVAQMKWK